MLSDNYVELIPSHLKGALDRYVEHGIPPGGFLTACLENNLSEAIGRADEISYGVLREIMAYLYNDVPSRCWGSPRSVESWMRERETLRKGLEKEKTDG